MKIRTDFVTNSSSSSFIVAIKTGVDVESKLTALDDKTYDAVQAALRIRNGFLDMAKNGVYKTLEDLKAHIMDYYAYGDRTLEQVLEEDTNAKEEYEQYKDYIERGYVIANFSIPFGSEDVLDDGLESMCDDDTVIKIWSGC